MKKASKILSAFLALVMVLALAVPAFAASTPKDVEASSQTGRLVIKNVVGQRTAPDGMPVYDIPVGEAFYKYFELDMEYTIGYMSVDKNYLPADFDADGLFGPYTLEDEYFRFSIVNGSEGNLYRIGIRVDGAAGAKVEYFYLNIVETPSSSTSNPGTSTSVKPAPGVSVPLNDGSGEFAYTVKSGDTLGKIAAYYYGNVNVYKLIYERNKDILKSANSIYAGQTIILPSYAAVAKGVATTQPSTPSQPSTPTQPSTPSNPSADVSVKPAPGVSVPLNDGSGEFAYTIKSGDTLSRIAAYYYGNANVYKLIFERNKDILKSANSIYAGQTIILPSYAAVAQGVAKI